MASNIDNARDLGMLLSKLKSCIEEMQACNGLLHDAEEELKFRVCLAKADVQSFIKRLINCLKDALQAANNSLNDFAVSELIDLKQKKAMVQSYMTACQAVTQVIEHNVQGFDTRLACKAVDQAEMLAENIRNSSKYNWLKFISQIQAEVSFEDIGYIKFCPGLDPDTFQLQLQSVLNKDDSNSQETYVTLYSNQPVKALLYSNQPYVAQASRYISCKFSDGAEGEDISTRLEDSKDGSYLIHFTPRSIGLLSLSVRVFGVEVKESPVDISVVEGQQPSSAVLSEGAREGHAKTSADQLTPSNNQNSVDCGWVEDDTTHSHETLKSGAKDAQNNNSGQLLYKGNYRPAGAIFTSKYPYIGKSKNSDVKVSETPGNGTWGRAFITFEKPDEETSRAVAKDPAKAETKAWGTVVNASSKTGDEIWGTVANTPVNTCNETWGTVSNAPVKTSYEDVTSSETSVTQVVREEKKGTSDYRNSGTNPTNVDVTKLDRYTSGTAACADSEANVRDSKTTCDIRTHIIDSAVKVGKQTSDAREHVDSVNDQINQLLKCSSRNVEEPPVFEVGGSTRKSILQQYIDRKITRVKTKFVTSIGRPGTGPDSLHMPIGVTVNSVNDVIICDTRHNLVKIFSMKGMLRKTIQKAGTNYSFRSPSAVTVNVFDEIYVKDDKAVHVFDASGAQYFHSIGENIVKRPYGLAFNSEDHLMLYDECRPQPKLYEFTMEAELVRESLFQPLLESKANFNSKCRFMTCSGEHVYVVDLGRSVVYKTTFAGTTEKVFGRLGRELGEFNEPSGISADSHGNLLIADSRNNRIQLFNNEAQACGMVELANEIIRPSDIHLTDTGILLVSNYLKHCIKIFQIEPLTP